MIIDVKYNPGEVVEYERNVQHEVFDICPCCYGDKIVIGQNGQNYSCPECKGTGKISTGEYIVEHEVSEGMINSAHVRYDSNTNNGAVQIYYVIPKNNGVYVQQEDILRALP